MIYSITIEELISQEFKINANSIEEAMCIAEKNIIVGNLCFPTEH